MSAVCSIFVLNKHLTYLYTVSHIHQSIEGEWGEGNRALPSAIALPVTVTCASTLAHKARESNRLAPRWTGKATWPRPKARNYAFWQRRPKQQQQQQQIRGRRGEGQSALATAPPSAYKLVFAAPPPTAFRAAFLASVLFFFCSPHIHISIIFFPSSNTLILNTNRDRKS